MTLSRTKPWCASPCPKRRGQQQGCQQTAPYPWGVVLVIPTPAAAPGAPSNSTVQLPGFVDLRTCVQVQGAAEVTPGVLTKGQGTTHAQHMRISYDPALSLSLSLAVTLTGLQEEEEREEGCTSRLGY